MTHEHAPFRRSHRTNWPLIVLIGLLISLTGPGLGSAKAAESGKGSWTLVQHMIEQRNGNAAVLLGDGTVLTMGGSSNSANLASAERYFPASNSWSTAGNMSASRYSHTATLLPDGRVLVAGGSTTGTSETNSTDIFSPSTNSWLPGPNMAVGRSLHTASLLPDGKVLVVGGDAQTTAGVTDSAEIYDPLTNSWTPAASIAVGRSEHTATILSDGRVLVTGGRARSSDRLATAEIYDPSTDSWSGAPDMSVDRLAHTATLLPDGRVLVAGGRGTTASVGQLAELYDPVADEWLMAPSMTAVHERHTATLLADGTVMVAGSSNPAEFYDPMANSWGSAFDMNVIRTGHPAVRLADGRVLIAGGCRVGIEDCATFTAEVYDPLGASFVLSDDISVVEGDASTHPAEFTVFLSRPLDYSVSVQYSAPDGTASWKDDDYLRTSGTLTFAPGETSKTITVPIIGDTVFERDERFFVRLSDPVDAGIGDGEGVATIINDDLRNSNTTSTSSLPPTTTTSSSLPPTTTSTTSTSLTTSTTSTTLPPSTTSTSSPPTTTTSLLEGPVEIDVAAQSNGNVTRLTGTVTCDEGNRYRLEITLTQGETEGQGVATGSCTGDPQSFRAVVTATSGPGYSNGTARAEVSAEIGDPITGTVVESFSAGADVEINVPGGMMAAILTAIERE